MVVVVVVDQGPAVVFLVGQADWEAAVPAETPLAQQPTPTDHLALQIAAVAVAALTFQAPLSTCLADPVAPA